MEKVTPTRRVRTNNSIDFFRGFLRDPRQVGSVIPSSRFMERSIIEYADLERAGLVVELGPGTGGTTRALLAAMEVRARLLAVDLNPAFTGIVAGIDDPRLIAHSGSAADLAGILAGHRLAAPDVVISGIPFSTMAEPIANAIIEAVHDCLAPGGRFVAYQFRAEVARRARPVFGPPARTEMVGLNIPPMRIWRWDKTG